MKTIFNGPDVISDLHKKGFSNDFHLSGNDLFWVRENLFIRAGEFAILEYHKIPGSKNKMDEFVVFGIIAPHHNIKGILIYLYKSSTNFTPPVLIKKLNELSTHAGINIDGNYSWNFL
jgi:hypothetical protein